MGTQRVEVSASFGVASTALFPDRSALSAASLIAAADAALYAAKRAGRDRVYLAPLCGRAPIVQYR